jgi:hypothetical protein
LDGKFFESSSKDYGFKAEIAHIKWIPTNEHISREVPALMVTYKVRLDSSSVFIFQFLGSFAKDSAEYGRKHFQSRLEHYCHIYGTSTFGGKFAWTLLD